MKTYKTAADIVADALSEQTARRNDGWRAIKRGDGRFYGDGVFAAFTFEGVRYVATRSVTKSGAYSKRAKTQTLSDYIERLEGHNIPADDLERIRRKYAA